MLLQGKKVMIVANVTWNVYNFRQNFVHALLDQGVNVHLAATPDSYVDFLKAYPQVTFIPLKSLRRTSRNPISDIAFLRELYTLYKRISPDLIIHYTIKPNIYGGLAASWLKIPYFSVVTGLGYAFIHNGWLESLTSKMYRLAFKRCAKVIFENNDDLSLFIEKGIIRENQGASVMGCGVDTEFYRRRFDSDSSEKSFNFAYIGRMLYDKGLSELIEAFQKIDQSRVHAKLYLIGDRDTENPACVSEDDFYKWISLPNVIHFQHQDDVRPFIEEAHCVVYPSYREGMPRLVLESLSMETPVITTRVAGCRETIEHMTHGYLVPVASSTDLSHAMYTMLQLSESKRLYMGRKGRERAEMVFKDDKIARDILLIIAHTLGYKITSEQESSIVLETSVQR